MAVEVFEVEGETARRVPWKELFKMESLPMTAVDMLRFLLTKGIMFVPAVDCLDIYPRQSR